MRKLATLTAAAALVAAFGFASAAKADPFADTLESFTPGTGSPSAASAGAEALGADDGIDVDLGADGILILRFTDNVCFDDGTTNTDFKVFELAAPSDGYVVDVGLIGESLTSLSSSGSGDTEFDLNVDSVVAFNRIQLTADGSGGAVATVDSFSQLEEPDARYRRLTTGIVQAPFGVQSARVRVLLRPRSSAAAFLYVDDVSLTAISAPTPSPTAPSTADSTPAGATPTPASTPSIGDISPQPNEGSFHEDGGRSGDSIVGGPRDEALVSEVLGASSDAPAAPLARPPTPVIERDSRLAALDPSPSSSGWARWLPWLITANVLGLAAVGLVAYRWGRRRRAAQEEDG